MNREIEYFFFPLEKIVRLKLYLIVPSSPFFDVERRRRTKRLPG